MPSQVGTRTMHLCRFCYWTINDLCIGAGLVALCNIVSGTWESNPYQSLPENNFGGKKTKTCLAESQIRLLNVHNCYLHRKPATKRLKCRKSGKPPPVLPGNRMCHSRASVCVRTQPASVLGRNAQSILRHTNNLLRGKKMSQNGTVGPDISNVAQNGPYVENGFFLVCVGVCVCVYVCVCGMVLL